MKHDYINFVNLKQNDDGGIGDVFKDSNSNGPYDFLFPKLKKYYFYGELPEKYILNITTSHFNMESDKSIVEIIKSNPRILEDLKSGNAKILINRSGEFDTFKNGKLTGEEYDSLFKLDIDKSNILYLGFNSIMEEAMCNSDIKSRYHNFTMLNLYSIIKDKEDLYREFYEKQKKSLREYYYLCYNNTPNPHRRIIVNFLKNEKTKGLLSSTEDSIFLDDSIAPDEVSWTYNNRNLYYYANQKHFFDSYFSIITESHYSDTIGSLCMTFSEKTWKVITNFHPFCLVGAKNSISKLREYGFETFSELFDEQYDRIDDVNRAVEICKQIDRTFLLTRKELTDICYSIEEKLIHNFHHFFRLCEIEIKSLEKYLLNFCNG